MSREGQGVGLRTGRGRIGRQVKLPWRRAVEISLKSLRVRFWRSMLTVSSIILAIAFLVYVWASGRFETAVAAGFRPDKEKVDELNRKLDEVWRPFERELAQFEQTLDKLKGPLGLARKDLAEGSLGRMRTEIQKQVDNERDLKALLKGNPSPEEEKKKRALGAGSRINFKSFPGVPADKLEELEGGARAIGISLRPTPLFWRVVETLARVIRSSFRYELWPEEVRDLSGIRLITLKAVVQQQVSYYDAIELALQRQGRKLSEQSGAATGQPGEGIGTTSVWLIIISLLVCAVGIVNAMLMSVSERFREIGTMKCLGALDTFIVKLFILESFFQGFSGTILGIVVGFVFTILASLYMYGGAAMSYFPAKGLLVTVLYAALAGAVLSVVAAVFPALRAARMTPVDAMRVEE